MTRVGRIDSKRGPGHAGTAEELLEGKLDQTGTKHFRWQHVAPGRLMRTVIMGRH